MRLHVDPIACESHGLCAELLPELITLDDWGHPLLADREISSDLERLARRAVRTCPTLALRIEESVAEGADRAARGLTRTDTDSAARARARARQTGR